MSDPLVLYPRAYVKLTVGLADGSEVTASIVPNKLKLERKSHRYAATCDVEFLITALPFEVRQIQAVFIKAYLGCVPSMEASVDAEKYARFVGYADELEVNRGERGEVVTLKARDLSQLLRDHKEQLPNASVPLYSDTLWQAITKVMRSVGGVTDALTIREVPDPGAQISSGSPQLLTDRKLSSAVADRAQSGAIQLPDTATAWDIVERACGILSLVASVDFDQIVIGLPKTIYAADQRPKAVLVYGDEDANVLRVSLKRKFLRNRKGVKVFAHDDRGHVLEVTWDGKDGKTPLVLKRPKPKKAPTHGHVAKPAPKVKSLAEDKKEHEVFTVEGVQTLDALRKVAEQIYNERSKQDTEGLAATPVVTDEIFALSNGDRIELKLSPTLAAEIKNLDIERAVAFLVARQSIDREAAAALVRAAKTPQTSLFYVNSLALDWSSRGPCMAEVGFINLIEIGA